MTNILEMMREIWLHILKGSVSQRYDTPILHNQNT